MKGIVISTDNEVEIKDFGKPIYETTGKEVGGSIELVRPTGLAKPYVMIVNEEGLILRLPLNRVGSILYGTHIHGSPIVGNIVIMKEGMTPRGPDIKGLSDEEIPSLMDDLRKAFKGPTK